MILHIIWNPDPEILNIFGMLSLRYYGVLFMTGLALGFFVVKYLYEKENLAVESLETIATYLFVGAIAGARIGHCLFYEPEYYLSHPFEIISPFTFNEEGSLKLTGFQGLASHGGAFGILAAVGLYSWKTKFNFWWLMDKIAVAAPIACAFIRIGNFMNSEIIGTPTQSMFGIIFEREDMLPRHPAQLYEALAYLLIFPIIFYSYRSSHHLRGNGFFIGMFFALACTARFVIEFFKINQVEFENGMLLNMGQWLSIPFVLFGVVMMITRRKVELVEVAVT